MQHLLDFIHEHTLDQHLYVVLPSSEGDLELSFQNAPGRDGVWQVRLRGSQEDGERIHYGDLLDALEQRGADMPALERELQAVVVTRIAFADMLLRQAKQVLGDEAVRRSLAEHREFELQLRAAVARILPPDQPVTLLAGGGAQTAMRTGHLKLVRAQAVTPT
jgi:hypothetical protein